MKRTRKQCSRRWLHPDFPATTARSITEFVLISVDQTESIGVEIIDWGIVVVARITSLTSVPLSVEKVTVNDDFTPVVAIGDKTGAFEPLEWPRGLSYGKSIYAVVQAPLTAAKTLAYCYPHLPKTITVSTVSDEFRFAAGQTVIQDD